MRLSLNYRLVTPLDHDPDKRFRSGRTDENASIAGELLLKVLYRFGDLRILHVVHFFVICDMCIDKRLGHHLADFCKLGERLSGFLHDGQKVESREQAVTGRVLVEVNDMTGLLAAEIKSLLEHALEDIPVSDLGFLDVDVFTVAHHEESEVAHDRYDDSVLFEFSLFLHVPPDDCHDLIAVYDISLFIDGQEPVRVAVEGKAACSTLRDDSFLQLFKVSRAAVLIDIRPVRIRMNRDKVCAESPDGLCIRPEGCALGAVHYEFHSGEVGRDKRHRILDVFLPHVKVVRDPSDIFAGREGDILHLRTYLGLDLVLFCIRQFEAAAVKKLDSVEFHRVVRCRDDDPRIRMMFFRKECDRRCRKNAEIDDVCADRARTGHQCVCQHIAGLAGVCSDHDERPMAVLIACKHICACFAELHCKKRRKLAVCDAAHTIRTEHSAHR